MQENIEENSCLDLASANLFEKSEYLQVSCIASMALTSIKKICQLPLQQGKIETQIFV